MNKEELIRELPKAELHVHLFGTLTSELFLKVGKRNGLLESVLQALPTFPNKYNFTDLADFIVAYDAGVSVFRTERDFYDITYDYLKRSAEENVVYVELIVDPQSHELFGVPLDTMMEGIIKAQKVARRNFKIESNLVLTFVRHLGGGEARRTFTK